MPIPILNCEHCGETHYATQGHLCDSVELMASLIEAAIPIPPVVWVNPRDIDRLHACDISEASTPDQEREISRMDKIATLPDMRTQRIGAAERD